MVLDTDNFRGKKLAWVVSFLHSFFGLLSLSAMVLQMLDRYLAIYWPVLYKAKKSMAKVIAIISVKWLVIFAIMLPVYVPLYGLDIGHASVLEYRELYSRESENINGKLLRFTVMSLRFYLAHFLVQTLQQQIEAVKEPRGTLKENSRLNTRCTSYLESSEYLLYIYVSVKIKSLFLFIRCDVFESVADIFQFLLERKKLVIKLVLL